MKRLLNRLTAAFSLVEIGVLLVIIILVGINLYQFQGSIEARNNLTQRSMPLRFKSLQLATSMDEQKAALIRYLVEGDTLQKMKYTDMELRIEGLIRDMIFIAESPEETGIIQQLDWLLDQLDAEGRTVLSMDESVDANYLEISEAIDDIDDLLDNQVGPYVDQLRGVKRERMEEIVGELETGIQECLLALSEYIMQKGAEESRSEFLEARSNIQLWQNVFIEVAQTNDERRWARLLNENMDLVILKADELMINFDRRMEEYGSYSKMESDADAYIEDNLLALSNRLLDQDIKNMDEHENAVFMSTLLFMTILVTLVIVDNYYKRKRQTQLKELELFNRDKQVKAIIHSQEVERSRYAQDLHDGYGQLIAVLKLNLQALQSKSRTPSPEAKKIFETANNVLQSMSDNLRRICFGLMPLTLKERGLAEAIQELALNINVSGTVKLDVESIEDLSELSEDERISIFRICQEWLNNILKHSSATLVKLNLKRTIEGIELTIDDNGAGFDKELLTHGTGHGWKNIQSRSRLLGGRASVSSRDNEGATFQLKISTLVRLSLYNNAALPIERSPLGTISIKEPA